MNRGYPTSASTTSSLPSTRARRSWASRASRPLSRKRGSVPWIVPMLCNIVEVEPRIRSKETCCRPGVCPNSSKPTPAESGRSSSGTDLRRRSGKLAEIRAVAGRAQRLDPGAHRRHILALCNEMIEFSRFVRRECADLAGCPTSTSRRSSSRDSNRPAHATQRRSKVTWIALLLADPSPCLRAARLARADGTGADDHPEMRELAQLRASDPLSPTCWRCRRQTARGRKQIRSGWVTATGSTRRRGRCSAWATWASAQPTKPCSAGGVALRQAARGRRVAAAACGGGRRGAGRLFDHLAPDVAAAAGIGGVRLRNGPAGRARPGYEWLLAQRLPDGAWPTGIASGNTGYMAGYRRLAHSRGDAARTPPACWPAWRCTPRAGARAPRRGAASTCCWAARRARPPCSATRWRGSSAPSWPTAS